IDKSSGPDGFTFDFYRQLWSTIDKDMYAVVNNFFINGDIPSGGLKINLCKSKIMGVNIEGSYVNQAAVKLGCQVLTSPFIYLGTKVGETMSRVQAWQEVVEKVKTRLSKWKMKMLSLEGQLTLLNLC
nr:RNA-directed DNA polymerase, eukaryota [Tanacetum cinerariifolium]